MITSGRIPQAAEYHRLTKETIACPCCRSLRFDFAVQGDRYDFGLRTVVCCDCGLIFTNPRPDRAWFDRFYRDNYRAVYESIETPDEGYLSQDWIRGRHERNLDWIAPHLGSRGRLLDIGCAEGTFLSRFQQRFPVWTVEGIEPSVSFSAFARSHYALSVTTCDIEQLASWPEGAYDLITAGHVLEHLLEPNQFFTAVRRLLRDGGMLFIDLPDAEGEDQGIGNLHIAHVLHFSQRTLRNFLDRHGFTSLVERKGSESPQWTFQALAGKQPEVPANWRPPSVASQRIARNFARHCRADWLSEARNRISRWSALWSLLRRIKPQCPAATRENLRHAEQDA